MARAVDKRGATMAIELIDELARLDVVGAAEAEDLVADPVDDTLEQLARWLENRMTET